MLQRGVKVKIWKFDFWPNFNSFIHKITSFVGKPPFLTLSWHKKWHFPDPILGQFQGNYLVYYVKLKYLCLFYSHMPQYATDATMSGNLYDTYILMLDRKIVEENRGRPNFWWFVNLKLQYFSTYYLCWTCHIFEKAIFSTK